VPDRCRDCHADLFSRYAMSMHGALTELGYGPAATCSDCHGAHDILPISDPASRLSSGNRLETCRKCHPEAARNSLDFDPHADHRTPDRDPVLYWVYVVLMTFLISTFGCFGLHSVLWSVRSLIDVVKKGRPKPLAPGDVAYVRFGPFHRVAHIVMVLSFLGLALTGLPLKYNHCEWAKVLARVLGGFAFTAYWHRMFGLVNIGCLVVYFFRMIGRLSVRPADGASRTGILFGPDSPVPTLRDLKDLLKAIRWFFGLGPKPTFERWAYWEKFDFWGACADIVIIGSTGLILWSPDFFCQGDSLDAGAVGYGIRFRHPLLQHASASGEIPHGYVYPDGAGERGGLAGGTPRVPGADAPGGQARSTTRHASAEGYSLVDYLGRIRGAGNRVGPAGGNCSGRRCRMRLGGSADRSGFSLRGSRRLQGANR
jgi:cytochrome b subunit of formate dehydrogenase